MKPGPDVSTIYRIARYYYADGLSQDQIAGKEGVSRSHISRLIDRARELGLVKIILVPPSSLRAEELARELSEAFCLRSATVVPVRNKAGDEEISLAIATRAAECLPPMLADFDSVGLGWGHTVYKTAELLPRGVGMGGKPFFVPMIGTSGDDNPNLQINTIIDRFAAAFRTKGLFVNTPCVRESGAGLSKIEGQRVAMLEKRWSQLDAAVIGLGGPPAESPNLMDELSAEYKAELKRSSACGDILAHFFDADGALFKAEHSYELLAFDIAGLGSLKRSICLAGGRAKGRGIAAAARAGFFSDLVTDECTAIEVLEFARSHHERFRPSHSEKTPASGAEAQ